MSHTALGQRLSLLRRERGLTLEETASRSGLNPATVSAIEDGRGSYDSAVAIANGLGARIEVRGLVRDRKASIVNLAEMAGLAPQTFAAALTFLYDPRNGVVTHQLSTLESVLKTVGGQFVVRVR